MCQGRKVRLTIVVLLTSPTVVSPPSVTDRKMAPLSTLLHEHTCRSPTTLTPLRLKNPNLYPNPNGDIEGRLWLPSRERLILRWSRTTIFFKGKEKLTAVNKEASQPASRRPCLQPLGSQLRRPQPLVPRALQEIGSDLC